jgi:HPr kinase/phosphorylase
MVDWNQKEEYDRIGFREDKYRLLSIDLPMVRVPISPGRNVSTIIELACRNYILKKQGINTAVELEEKILKSMEAEEKS